MRASEILRKLADTLDSEEAGNRAPTEITNRPAQNAVEVPTDTAGIEDQAQVNVDSMVSPLQQKLELLKKSVGVENSFDDECCDAEGTDELDIVKKNAGLPNIVAIQASADDNDIEG